MKDLARIYVKAGDGGRGSAHFLHGKYQPKGGPDGGDGGDGGDVVLVADENIQNLVEFNFKKRFVVPDGEQGYGKNMHGKNTEDLEVKVPVGSVVYEIPVALAEMDLRNREVFEKMQKVRRLVIDMTQHGQRFEVAWGGRGGRGNWQFRSATNQTPTEFEEGKPGDAKWLLLELKMVADVGIVGLPNVGKSSLLKALTNANPKIAGYPFTTLEPNLGVLRINHKSKILKFSNEEKQALVLVDVPGVVEDAWEGKGIGPWFLRHLERTKTLIHVLAPNCSDTVSQLHSVTEQMIHDYQIVRKEFEKYGRGLSDKPEIVVVNKMELVDMGLRKKIEVEFAKKIHKDLVWISAGMGEVAELVDRIGLEPTTSSMP
ncbi:MAG: GTPase ObgE [bacterium]